MKVRDDSPGGHSSSVFTAVALLAACSAFQPPAERPPPPDLTFQHLVAQQYKAGQLDWRGAFQTLAYERNVGHVEAERIILVPTSGSSAGSRLVATRGNGSMRSGITQLEGGVTFDGIGGDHAETSACTINFASHTAHGDQTVRMRGQGYTLEAAAFDSSFARPMRIQLNGSAHAVVDTHGDAP